MLMTFTVPCTGHVHQIQLPDAVIHEYRMTIEEMEKFRCPQLDRLRRAAHNKLSTPICTILRDEMPDKTEKELMEEARNLTTQFLDNSPVGRSTVGVVRNSALYI